MTSEERQALRTEQREALWRWRWLGLRRSTPGFKGALLLLAMAAAWIGATYLGL